MDKHSEEGKSEMAREKEGKEEREGRKERRDRTRNFRIIWNRLERTGWKERKKKKEKGKRGEESKSYD